MPIKISDSLPARTVLEGENIFVMTERRALSQDIRPLRLLILNLMPDKVTTETQLLRCLSNTPIQIEVSLLQTATYKPRNTAEDHLLSFYTTFNRIQDSRFDGMIVTGAPVEQMRFEDVDYWPELCEILDWAQEHVHSTLHICWGAQAALYRHYGVPKYELPQKVFGVFPHTVCRPHIPLFRGFDDVFPAPHSRHTEIREADFSGISALEVLSVSEEAGVFAAMAEGGRQIFITGHPEYDALTLDTEYKRDLGKGLDIDMPRHYYPGNDASNPPPHRWRSHASLLYTNWLNYYVYQETPYDFAL
jgi:homoserine O-succinyltransferase